MRVGIIGYGRFGKLAAKYLKEDFEVAAYDKDGGDLEAAASADIVILCVPISQIRDAIASIRPYLKKGSIVLDTCSVKEYPCELMKELDVEILGTHPLFGPDSAKESLEGRSIVLCPINCKNTAKIKRYLESKGLKVIETTPEEHDRQIARSLCLVHFIGRSVPYLEKQEISTLGYERLLQTLDQVHNDTKQLFDDMNRYNRYSEDERKRFLKHARELDEGLS